MVQNRNKPDKTLYLRQRESLILCLQGYSLSWPEPTARFRPMPFVSLMAAKVVNLTNGHRYKFSQTLRHIEQCNVAWVQYGVSVRNLELDEKVKARSEQARLREPLAYAEVHGLRFDPAASGVVATRMEKNLIWQAHQFVAEQAA